MTTDPKSIAEPLLLKAGQAAAVLGISERKLWELTNRGVIPCVRIGRSVRYSRRTLEAWIAEHEHPGT